MTNHPSFQPALRRANVATLIRFILNERDDIMASDASAEHSENAAYMRGLQYAVDTIMTMWASAVIASDAVEQTIRDGLVHDEEATPLTCAEDALYLLEAALSSGPRPLEPRAALLAARDALADAIALLETSE